MNTPIHSPIFGSGFIRNAHTQYQFAEFAEPDKPRLWLWPDGSYSLSGHHGMCYNARLDDIDEVVAEVKRLAMEVKQ